MWVVGALVYITTKVSNKETVIFADASLDVIEKKMMGNFSVLHSFWVNCKYADGKQQLYIIQTVSFLRYY
jgi:hypothetical protein